MSSRGFTRTLEVKTGCGKFRDRNLNFPSRATFPFLSPRLTQISSPVAPQIEDWTDGLPHVTILILGFLIYGLYYTLSIGIFLRSQNWIMPYIYGTGVLVNLLFNVILVKEYGALGAALAMLLTFGIVSAFQGLIAQRYYPIPFEFNRLGKILLVGTALFMTGRFFMSEGTPYLVLRTGLIALFPVALYGLGFFTDEERNKAFYFSHHLRLRGALIAKAILKRREQ